MAKTKKAEAAGVEAVQESPVQELDPIEAAPAEEIPQDPYQELMEPDPAEAAPIEYAVTGCDYLNLRESPSLDACVIVRLPRGVGVSDTGEAQGEWCKVTTGRLTGWVMAQYLEPVWS